MKKMINPKELCELLCISRSTMYRWIKAGKLTPAFRTIGNHRRFDLSVIKSLFFNTNQDDDKLTITYARVSSHDQKSDLITQQNKLTHYATLNNFKNITPISDLGSGLNYKKKGLNLLINLILNHKVSHLILNHKDRLLRFGSDLIFNLCSHFNVKVTIIEEHSLNFQESLAHDVIELMTVFCAKLYRLSF
jgi:excisionase family DNA binding protein